MQKAKSYVVRLLSSIAVSGLGVFFVVTLLLNASNTPCHNISYSASNAEAISTHKHQKGNASVGAVCNRNNQQITWVNWLFQRSESHQFHYADLLELLNKQP